MAHIERMTIPTPVSHARFACTASIEDNLPDIIYLRHLGASSLVAVH
jgi:hypothetical protein